MAATNPTDKHLALRTPDQAQELVLDVLRDNADSLLGVARRHSLCLDDAHDAYQRALEIFLRHAHRLEAEGAPRWIHTVVKHEAMRLRADRQRQVPSDDVDLDAHEARHLPDAEERVLAFDRVTRSAEALQRLKPQELRALWLQAQGLSYQEIADHCNWSYTKVNRCITEGRRSFLARYAGIEAGEECTRWSATLSALVDGEASAADVASLRPHLRNCGVCRATVRELHGSRGPIAALLPLPLASAAGGGSDDVSGLLTRAWELISVHLPERAAGSALKLHAAVEAASAGKVAAVAASAAVLAGGGVAADHAVNGHRPGPAAVTAQPATNGGLLARSAQRRSSHAGSASAVAEFSLAQSPATREFELGDATAATTASASGAREFTAPKRPRTSSPSGGRTRVPSASTVVDASQAAAEFGP